jgi:putative FmdB family regulatory protein
VPTYQYTCTKCGHDLEARQSFSDKALTDCPSCGVDGALRKQFGAVGVVFKGSGFYRNDSRSSNSKELSKNNSTPKKSDEKKAETKSESKSESTSTGAPKKKESAPAKA